MRKKQTKALTMVEIMIVVAVIAMLAGGIFFVSSKAGESARQELVKSTLAALDTALEQYYDYAKAYPPDVNYANPGNLGNPDIQMALNASGGLSLSPPNGAYQNDPYAESVEVLYYYLNRVPQSRAVLGKLPESAVSSKAAKLDAFNKPLASRSTDPNIMITINGNDVSLFRVVDPWNMPLQYTQYRVNSSIPSTNFPLLRSAGPDRKYGTSDDIVNRKN